MTTLKIMLCYHHWSIVRLQSVPSTQEEKPGLIFKLTLFKQLDYRIILQHHTSDQRSEMVLKPPCHLCKSTTIIT